MNVARRPDPKVDMLGTVDQLSGLPTRELEALATYLFEVSFEPGDVLMEEGRTGHEAFLIIEGQATVEVNGNAVGTAGPGEFVGEMALLEKAPRAATVTASTSIRALVADPASFHALLGSPGVRRLLGATMTARLRGLQSPAPEVAT